MRVISSRQISETSIEIMERVSDFIQMLYNGPNAPWPNLNQGLFTPPSRFTNRWTIISHTKYRINLLAYNLHNLPCGDSR